MNTETIRKMPRAELEDEMAELDLFIDPDDTDDDLRNLIVAEHTRIGERAAELQEEGANEAYYGGDSPGFYGPDDPGPGGR